MKKFIHIILAIGAALSFAACSPEFEVENTSTMELAGNWFCDVFYLNNGAWDHSGYTTEIITYNTAANDGKYIWVDDEEGYWGTKCKVPCNVSKLSFGTSDELVDVYNGKAQKIWGGKITKNGAKAPGTDTTVDKIELYIQFGDDTYKDTYCYVGYRRTGFPEDDYETVGDWGEAMPSTDTPEWSF